MKIEYFRHIFEKYSDIKFHENSPGGSRDVLCGRTDRRTGMTKLIVAFRGFANSPKMFEFTPDICDIFEETHTVTKIADMQ